jgi:hypothetical protein
MEHAPAPPGRLWADLVDMVGAKYVMFPQLREVKSNSREICEDLINTLFKQVDVTLLYEDLLVLSRSCSGQFPPTEECSPFSSPPSQAMLLPGELDPEDDL